MLEGADKSLLLDLRWLPWRVPSLYLTLVGARHFPYTSVVLFCAIILLDLNFAPPAPRLAGFGDLAASCPGVGAAPWGGGRGSCGT